MSVAQSVSEAQYTGSEVDNTILQCMNLCSIAAMGSVRHVVLYVISCYFITVCIRIEYVPITDS